MWAPVGLLFTKFEKLTIYYIWNIQASNFSSVPYLKDFGTFQLEFETVELYNLRSNFGKNKSFFTPWLVHLHKKKGLWLYFSAIWI